MTAGNLERLSELYDPAFVRRVSLVGDGAPVQVCLDSRMLGVAQGTGVATYAEVLAACLPQTGAAAALLDDGAPRPRVRRWLSALDPAPRYAEERDPGAWASSDVFREAQIFFDLHGRLLPVRCDRPPAVMHWTYPVPLYVEGARNLYTVHDLIPLTDPDLTTIPRDRHARLLAAIARQAACLVTVSEAMRAAVSTLAGDDGPPVENAYQAVLAPLQADPPLPAGLRPGKYLLFAGTVERRKNIDRLLAAHRRSGVPLPLVIVGPRAGGEAALEARIDAAPGVIRVPWQERGVLLALMRRARALVFPSLAEGFGLPIAEAMTLGCPVLTSAGGAPAEIGGDAALLVDPRDEAAIAQGIAQLATDGRLCAGLRARGFARARLFTREAYIARLRALYAGVLAR